MHARTRHSGTGTTCDCSASRHRHCGAHASGSQPRMMLAWASCCRTHRSHGAICACRGHVCGCGMAGCKIQPWPDVHSPQLYGCMHVSAMKVPINMSSGSIHVCSSTHGAHCNIAAQMQHTRNTHATHNRDTKTGAYRCVERRVGTWLRAWLAASRHGPDGFDTLEVARTQVFEIHFNGFAELPDMFQVRWAVQRSRSSFWLRSVSKDAAIWLAASNGDVGDDGDDVG